MCAFSQGYFCALCKYREATESEYFSARVQWLFAVIQAPSILRMGHPRPCSAARCHGEPTAGKIVLLWRALSGYRQSESVSCIHF